MRFGRTTTMLAAAGMIFAPIASAGAAAPSSAAPLSIARAAPVLAGGNDFAEGDGNHSIQLILGVLILVLIGGVAIGSGGGGPTSP